MESILLLFGAGALGALVKLILTDNTLVMPKVSEGALNLGFLGATIIGACAGYAIDGSYLTAFMGGMSGSVVIAGLVDKKKVIAVVGNETVEEMIRRIAEEETVDPDLAVRVARAESNLNPKAVNVNKTGSIDRGIYQINNQYHPEVTEAQAFDVEFSVRFFCKAFKEGHLSWWNASKKNWDK